MKSPTMIIRGISQTKSQMTGSLYLGEYTEKKINIQSNLNERTTHGTRSLTMITRVSSRTNSQTTGSLSLGESTETSYFLRDRDTVKPHC